MNNTRIENTEFKKLIGKWRTTGRILATEKNPEMKITGSDTYELILDGFYILHKADVLMGSENSQTFELIGVDETDGTAIFEHYNNQGASGRMTGTFKNHELKINGKFLRFYGQLNDNETQINGTWEKLDEQNNWEDFLKINLTKRKE